MLPGPNIYKECPLCKKIFSEDSLESGNTFGSTLWSDGKMTADMLPETPEIAGCPECNEVFWIEDAEIIGEYDWFNGEDFEEPEEWKSAESIKELDVEGYQKAIERGLGSNIDREKYLRIHLWWALNDLVRYEEKQPKLFKQHEKLFQRNLESLVELLDEGDDADQIMKAEIARELGDLDTCLIRLKDIPKKHEAICNQIRQFVQQKSCLVQQLRV